MVLNLYYLINRLNRGANKSLAVEPTDKSVLILSIPLYKP
ncbi:hypothetical protein bcere0009_27740 [Bacillus cereus R309803]|nr:hypothetical protein bcere0009_27740 [Bacillus cereus R309803]